MSGARRRREISAAYRAAECLNADEAHYAALAARTAALNAPIRFDLQRRRIRRMLDQGAVLGMDGTFAECKARNQAILRGAR